MMSGTCLLNWRLPMVDTKGRWYQGIANGPRLGRAHVKSDILIRLHPVVLVFQRLTLLVSRSVKGWKQCRLPMTHSSITLTVSLGSQHLADFVVHDGNGEGLSSVDKWYEMYQAARGTDRWKGQECVPGRLGFQLSQVSDHVDFLGHRWNHAKSGHVPR